VWGAEKTIFPLNAFFLASCSVANSSMFSGAHDLYARIRVRQSCDKIIKHVSLSEKMGHTEEGGLCSGIVFFVSVLIDQNSQNPPPPSTPGSLIEMTIEVNSFSDGSLDSSLFDIPAGFTRITENPDQIIGGKPAKE
jgi:hypothetical protein